METYRRETTATAAVIALGISLTSCCAVNTACTLIGCDDGLVVEVEGNLPPGVSVEAVAGDGERRVKECAQGTFCVVVFEGFHPNEVTVSATTGERAVTVTVEPEYAELRPNGRCCPPTCRTATVSIVL